jgi:hypothetical protein
MVKFVTTEKKNSHRRKHELGINQLTSTVTVIWCSPLLYNSGCHRETYRGPSTCSTFDDNGLPSIAIWTDVMSYGVNTSNLEAVRINWWIFLSVFSYWIGWGQPQMYQRSCCISCTRMILVKNFQFSHVRLEFHMSHNKHWSFTWKISIETFIVTPGKLLFRNELS